MLPARPPSCLPRPMPPCHPRVSPRVPVLTAGARHVSLPHGTCGQGTCLPWTGCGCSTDVEGPLLLRARAPRPPGTAAAARLPGVQQSAEAATGSTKPTVSPAAAAAWRGQQRAASRVQLVRTSDHRTCALLLLCCGVMCCHVLSCDV